MHHLNCCFSPTLILSLILRGIGTKERQIYRLQKNDNFWKTPLASASPRDSSHWLCQSSCQNHLYQWTPPSSDHFPCLYSPTSDPITQQRSEPPPSISYICNWCLWPTELEASLKSLHWRHFITSIWMVGYWTWIIHMHLKTGFAPWVLLSLPLKVLDAVQSNGLDDTKTQNTRTRLTEMPAFDFRGWLSCWSSLPPRCWHPTVVLQSDGTRDAVVQKANAEHRTLFEFS